jgi:hypothetical protein
MPKTREELDQMLSDASSAHRREFGCDIAPIMLRMALQQMIMTRFEAFMINRFSHLDPIAMADLISFSSEVEPASVAEVARDIAAKEAAFKAGIESGAILELSKRGRPKKKK